MTAEPFELWCEIESPAAPDLARVGRQVEAWSAIAAGYVVPDNHLGRPTVSSLAVAHHVISRGGVPMACLNARDRNLLGVRRDLLTAGALGIADLLLVYGDQPTIGHRTSRLGVRDMLTETRRLRGRGLPLRIGVTARLGPLPAWKCEADFLFAQVGFSLPDLVRWRDTVCFDGPIYAGVIVLPSAPMARRLAAAVPQIRVPAGLIEAVERDGQAGVDFACEMISRVRHEGGFSGVHLVPGVRSRAMAARLLADRIPDELLISAGGGPA